MNTSHVYLLEGPARAFQHLGRNLFLPQIFLHYFVFGHERKQLSTSSYLKELSSEKVSYKADLLASNSQKQDSFFSNTYSTIYYKAKETCFK